MSRTTHIVDFEEARSASRRCHMPYTTHDLRSGTTRATARSSSQFGDWRPLYPASNREMHRSAPFATDTGSRAAVYRKEAGFSRRQGGLQMHNEREATLRGAKDFRAKRRSLLDFPRFVKVLGGVAVCLMVCVIAIYQPAHDYYIASREEAKAQAQLEVLSAQNESLSQEVAALSTDSGIQDRAALDYGWVQKGENPVVVTGVSSGKVGVQPAAEIVSVNAVRAPKTWYSHILDKLFGYDG